jgi:hypothetical protein
MLAPDRRSLPLQSRLPPEIHIKLKDNIKLGAEIKAMDRGIERMEPRLWLVG